MAPSDPSRPRDAGFTLIELLIVIGIVGILAWAFLPNILGAQDTGMRTDTEVRMTALSVAIDGFERRQKLYPADNFDDPSLEVSAKNDNGINTGIESLMLYIHSVQGLSRFSDHEDWLSNTDDDQNGSVIQYLDRSSRQEVSDLWGTPFAYFSSWNDGYKREQKIMRADLSVVSARAWKLPDGGYLAPRKYQIISAGPDLLFNTDDDLVFPQRPL